MAKVRSPIPKRADTRSFVLAILLTLVLLIASCGGDTSESGVTEAAGELQTLEEYLGWADIDPQLEKQRVLEEATRHEEVVADCMAGKGLEYTVFIPFEPDWTEMLWGLTDNEAKLRFGYGFFAAALEEIRFNEEHADEFPGENPNEAIHSQQAPEGVDYMGAWNECGDLADEVAPIDPDPALREALEEAWGPLDSLAQEMWQQMESDPRLPAAEADWSACMAEAGYDFATEEDIEEYLWSLAGDLEEPGSTVPSESVTYEAELEPLADVELAIAAADVACRGDLDQVRDQVQREYECAFIAEHLEELEPIRVLVQELVQQGLYGRDT
jgi:hypothetical protein